MLARLELLYGPETAPAVHRELIRLIRVHRAHATPELDAEERAFEPQRRYDETDVVLITYGDLLVSDTRSPLQTLADFTEVFFRGIVTTLHILPFFPHSSDRGFSVTSYTDVDPRLGTWDEIDQLSCPVSLNCAPMLNQRSATAAGAASTDPRSTSELGSAVVAVRRDPPGGGGRFWRSSTSPIDPSG